MKITASLFAAVVLIGASPCLAAPPAADVARDFLEVFNRGDAASAQAFLRIHWPANPRAAPEMRERRAQSGGYDLVKVEQETDAHLTEILRARLADDYLRLELEVAPEGDHAITRLMLTPTDRPTDTPRPKRLPPRELGRLVDTRLAAMGDFSGAVLIAVNGQVIYERAAGLADRERVIPNTAETPFGLASMGKMFTAVGIFQLAQAGQLDLDATVGTYIQEYPNAEFARRVTITSCSPTPAARATSCLSVGPTMSDV